MPHDEQFLALSETLSRSPGSPELLKAKLLRHQSSSPPPCFAASTQAICTGRHSRKSSGSSFDDVPDPAAHMPAACQQPQLLQPAGSCSQQGHEYPGPGDLCRPGLNRAPIPGSGLRVPSPSLPRLSPALPSTVVTEPAGNTHGRPVEPPVAGVQTALCTASQHAEYKAAICETQSYVLEPSASPAVSTIYSLYSGDQQPAVAASGAAARTPPSAVRARASSVRMPALLEACAEGRTFELKAILSRSVNIACGVNLTAAPNHPLWGRMAAIHIAAIKGSVAMVQMLIRAGAKVDLPTAAASGATALILAAKEGHAEVIDALARGRANVNFKDADGLCALLHAAVKGNIKCMRVLLRAGAWPNVSDGNGYTPLMAVCSTGTADMVQLLLAAGSNVAAQTKDGSTALSFAAQRGSLDVMGALLEHGCPLDVPGLHRRTPLMLAALSGHAAAVHLLLTHTVSLLSAQDEDGHTAVHLAAQKGCTQVLGKLEVFKRSGKLPQVDCTAADGSTALMHAVDKGCLGAVESLVRMGAAVNMQRKDGLTALHIAAQAGHMSLLKLLLGSGANVNARTKQGLTPLMLAASNGRARAVEALLRYGAHAKHKGSDGRTALHLAAENGHARVVQMLVVSPCSKVGCRSKDGMTPLMLAVAQGHCDVAEALVAASCDVNQQAADGRTALHMALEMAHAELAELLLNAGAYVNSRTQEDVTPLMAAAQGGDVALLKAVLKAGGGLHQQSGDGSVAAHFAAAAGHAEAVKLLVAEGQPPNTKNKDGMTPALMACVAGHLPVLQALLDLGAESCQKDFMGRSALHLAAAGGHTNCVELLVGNNANLNCRCQDGMTPLMAAAEAGHDEVVAVLLRAGADTRRQTNDGRTAMHRAAATGSVAVLKALLGHGCNVNCRAKDGTTPLLAAVQRGCEASVQVLVRSSSHLNHHHTTEDGRVALHLAAHSGNCAIITTLLEGGSNVNCRSKDGMTPLMMAAAGAHAEAVDVLLSRGAEACRQAADNWCAMHYAANSGCAPAITLLADRGADVHCRTKKDALTPLMLASMGGHAGCVAALLALGADPSQQANDGRTAAHLAAHCGCTPVLQLLLEHSTEEEKCSQPAEAVSMADSGARAASTKDAVSGGTASSAAGLPVADRLQGGLDTASRDGITPLMAAAASGHAAAVQLLLEAGARTDTASKAGSALHVAAGAGHAPVVQLLVSKGCNTSCCTTDGTTPLMAASIKGYAPAVEALLSVRSGRDTLVQHSNKAGWTALHLASKAGHTRVVELLLGASAQVDVLGGPNHDATPLMLASAAGHTALVQALITHGAEVNLQNAAGLTALHMAAATAHAATMKVLLVNGASPSLQDHKGKTALVVASAAQQPATLQELQNWKCADGVTACQLSNKQHPSLDGPTTGKRTSADLALVCHPLDNMDCSSSSTPTSPGDPTGGSPHSPAVRLNSRSVEGSDEAASPPGIPACKLGSPPCSPPTAAVDDTPDCLSSPAPALPRRLARSALTSGSHASSADVLAWLPRLLPDPLLQLPVIRAGITGCSEQLQRAVRTATDARLVDADGCNAMHHAARQGHSSIVHALLAQGVSVDVTCLRAMTPLSYAAAAGHTAVMQVLLKAGANPRHRSVTLGRCVLHHAALQGCSEALEMLLTAGTPVEERDELGFTAIMLAACLDREGSAGAVQLLARAGANVNHHRLMPEQGQRCFSRLHCQPESRGTGFTLLMAAARRGWVGTLQVLVDSGASVADVTRDGCTVLHIAALAGRISALKLLVPLVCRSPAASVDPPNQEGVTPLMCASRHCQGAVAVSLLVASGARVAAKDRKGNTPLHFAAEVANADAMKALLGFGAEPSARNNLGSTPLMLLARLRSAHCHRPLWLRSFGSRVAVAARVLFDAGATADPGDEDSQHLLRIAAVTPLGVPAPTLPLPSLTKEQEDKHRSVSSQASTPGEQPAGKSTSLRALLERAMQPVAAAARTAASSATALGDPGVLLAVDGAPGWAGHGVIGRLPHTAAAPRAPLARPPASLPQTEQQGKHCAGSSPCSSEAATPKSRPSVAEPQQQHQQGGLAASPASSTSASLHSSESADAASSNAVTAAGKAGTAVLFGPARTASGSATSAASQRGRTPSQRGMPGFKDRLSVYSVPSKDGSQPGTPSAPRAINLTAARPAAPPAPTTPANSTTEGHAVATRGGTRSDSCQARAPVARPLVKPADKPAGGSPMANRGNCAAAEPPLHAAATPAAVQPASAHTSTVNVSPTHRLHQQRLSRVSAVGPTAPAGQGSPATNARAGTLNGAAGLVNGQRHDAAVMLRHDGGQHTPAMLPGKSAAVHTRRDSSLPQRASATPTCTPVPPTVHPTSRRAAPSQKVSLTSTHSPNSQPASPPAAAANSPKAASPTSAPKPPQPSPLPPATPLHVPTTTVGSPTMSSPSSAAAVAVADKQAHSALPTAPCASPPQSLEDACKKAAAAVGKALARTGADACNGSGNEWYSPPMPRCSSMSMLKAMQPAAAGPEFSRG